MHDQSCPTLCNPMDCSLPGSSVHGYSPGKNTGVGCISFPNNNTFSSVRFSRSVMSDSLQPHESRHTRPSCPSPTLGVYPNSCPLSRWSHPTISSSVVPFSSCLQSFPASGSFLMSQFFNFYKRNFNVNIKMIWISIFFLEFVIYLLWHFGENFKE